MGGRARGQSRHHHLSRARPIETRADCFWLLCVQILALSRAFSIPIHVVQVGPPTIVVHSPDPDAKHALTPAEAKVIRGCKLTFHTRSVAPVGSLLMSLVRG